MSECPEVRSSNPSFPETTSVETFKNILSAAPKPLFFEETSGRNIWALFQSFPSHFQALAIYPIELPYSSETDHFLMRCMGFYADRSVFSARPRDLIIYSTTPPTSLSIITAETASPLLSFEKKLMRLRGMKALLASPVRGVDIFFSALIATLPTPIGKRRWEAVKTLCKRSA